MIVGDVIVVHDGSGDEVEAVLKRKLEGHRWQCELISGPNDGDEIVVQLED